MHGGRPDLVGDGRVSRLGRKSEAVSADNCRVSAVSHDTEIPRGLSPVALLLVPRHLVEEIGPVSPELALVDASLRERLLSELPEPGAGSRPAGGRDLAALSVDPPAQPLADPPSEGVTRSTSQHFVEQMGARQWSSTRVVGLAAVFATLGFAFGFLGHGGERMVVTPPSVEQVSEAPAGIGVAVLHAPPAGSATRTQHRSVLAVRPATIGGRTFAWASAAGASGYEVQFFRGSARVFVRRVASTRLALPSGWRYAGGRQSLVAGLYRWYVWPLRGRAGERDPTPVVQASFTVPRRE